MAWNLKCYGIEKLENTREDHMDLLAYMIKDAKRCPAYGGEYLNYYMKSVQFCLQARREEGVNYSIDRADTHNTDSRVWNCTVESVLSSDSEDGMSKCILVSAPDKGSIAAIELINADILPSYDHGEEIQIQVIGQGMQVRYYADEKEYEQAEGFDIEPGHPTLEPGKMTAALGSLLPVGFMEQHAVDEDDKVSGEIDPRLESLARVTGVAKAFALKEVEFEGKVIAKYISCLVDTPFGELPLVHTFGEVPQEYHENLKVGAVVSALCRLSGDVLIYDYENGLVLNEDNNLKLFKYAINNRGQWHRLYPVLAEDCYYISESSRKEITGRDEIIRFLTDREQKQNSPEMQYHSCYGRLLKPKCEASLVKHPEGTRMIALWQGEERKYEAIVFLHTNHSGMVDEIHLCRDNRYWFETFDDCLPAGGSKPEEAEAYKGLNGEVFLRSYFQDHGLHKREINLLASWGYFAGSNKMTADQYGMDYAKRVTEKMKRYRGFSADYVANHLHVAPWYWPTAMEFQRFAGEPPVSNDKVWGIIECVYQGKCYLFGIGKAETTIIEDMRKNGKWSVYTYSD